MTSHPRPEREPHRRADLEPRRDDAVALPSDDLRPGWSWPDADESAVGGGDRLGGCLRDIADDVESHNRLMGRIAGMLADVSAADGLHGRLGGMTLQVWLEHVCRIPGGDARALLGVVDVLARMPALSTGLADGWVSWGQAQAICRAARTLRVTLLTELDQMVIDAMVASARYEPDALVDQVWRWIDGRQPSRLEREQHTRDRGEFVALQPMRTGGGTLYGELGTVSFGIVAEQLSPTTPPAAPATPDGDTLDAVDADDLDDMYATLDEAVARHTRDHGAAMAARLVGLCTDAAAGIGDDGPSGGGAGRGGGSGRPLVLVTIDLDALLDATRTPGWLLHTLSGGRMKLSATALQQLVDTRGADVRGIVLDDCGQAVGVGRTSRIPPGWLRQAIWARDTRVTDPHRACPVRRADIDHVVAWPAGPTDVDNLHPVGRRWHNHKTSRTWTVTRHADGATTWRHRRHGWTLTTAPPRTPLDPTTPPGRPLGPPGTCELADPPWPPGTRTSDPPGDGPTGSPPDPASATQPTLTGVP